MPSRKLVGFLTLVVLVAGLFLAVTSAWADATKTKTLISGQGAIGARDGANKFSLDGGATFSPAFIVAPDPAWAGAIAGTIWISSSPTLASPPGAVFPTTSVTIIYRTHFNLPATFDAPSLTVDVHADNGVAVFVNNNPVGSQSLACCPGGNFTGAPSTFVDSTADDFQKGRNVLEFRIDDFGGVTGLDYNAAITYTAKGKGK